MKIYTRTGDKGTTGLFGGDRVNKDHPRIMATGHVDETNAFLGMARVLLKGQPGEEILDPLLDRIQTELFTLGADLATPLESRASAPRMRAEHATFLEEAIDTHEQDLAPLKNFILQGGTQAAAMLHLARAVCRRAERTVVTAAREEPLTPHTLIYLNRLSDLLFVLARWVNAKANVDDVLWNPIG